MYKILGADGKEYGPIAADVLKKWIAEGRANAQTRVLPEGATEWKTLGEIPELAAALPAVAPPIFNPHSDEPGTALPPDVRERDYDLDLGGCISRGWALLTGPRAWLVIGGIAIWLLIQAGLNGLAQIPILGLIFSIVSFVIGGPFMGGVSFFILRCLRGGPAQVEDIFAGFKYRFGQLFLSQLVLTLIIIASILPGVVMLVIGVLFAAHHHGSSEIIGVGLILMGVLVMLPPLIYFSVSWYFTLPLIMDKRLDFWPAMSLSRKVVGKHWFMVLLLVIIVGIISGIGILFCCVGLFFTVPLAMAIAMAAYERLFSLPTPAAQSPQT